MFSNCCVNGNCRNCKEAEQIPPWENPSDYKVPRSNPVHVCLECGHECGANPFMTSSRARQDGHRTVLRRAGSSGHAVEYIFVSGMYASKALASMLPSEAQQLINPRHLGT